MPRSGPGAIPPAFLLPASAPARQTVFVCGVGFLFLLAIALRAPYANGAIWAWPWRDPPLLSIYAYCLLPLPLLLWSLRESERGGGRPYPILSAWMLLSLALQILALFGEEHSLDKLARIVMSPDATSYFTDAAAITAWPAWLAEFHAQQLHLHANTHPPGPTLYYYALITALGADRAAMAGGLLLGLLTSAGVFVMYHFAALWELIRERGFSPAASMRFCPV
jgi:hypothetical protein